eukprot:5633940-Prymnesium_polylepis.1
MPSKCEARSVARIMSTESARSLRRSPTSSALSTSSAGSPSSRRPFNAWCDSITDLSLYRSAS